MWHWIREILKGRLLIWILILSGLIFPLLLFNFDFYINSSTTIDSNKADEVGSWLAGTTGLLWGLASILLIYKSFELSRKQKEENNFFSLMNNLHTVVNNIEAEFTDTVISKSKTTMVDKVYKGTAFFSRFFWRYYNEVYNNENFQEYLKIENELDIPFACKVKEIEPDRMPKLREYILTSEARPTLLYKIWCYKNLYEPYHSQLGHFFRVVFNIINYIHSSQHLNKSEKKRLVNLIQAQLTNDQLGVIFYNILSGYEKFYKLVHEEYPDFFQNIDANSLIDASDIKYYPNANFDIAMYRKPLTMKESSLDRINALVSEWEKNLFLLNHQKNRIKLS